RFEGYRLEDLDPERRQISGITVVGVFKMHRYGPWRQRLPAITQQRHATELGADRRPPTQYRVSRGPAGLALPDINHAEFLGRAVAGSLPPRIKRIEQKRAYVAGSRMIRRLTNLVGQRLADGDPLCAIVRFPMIIVAVD